MGQRKVRMLLPMSLHCNTCRNYMYKATKFNSIRQDVIGEEMNLGIQMFKFYIKCSKCKAEIILKTDPNADYVVESGGLQGMLEPVGAEDEIPVKGFSLSNFKLLTWAVCDSSKLGRSTTRGSAFPAASIARDEKCLWDGKKRLASCGDFCVSPNVEGALLTGLAAASKFTEIFSSL